MSYIPLNDEEEIKLANSIMSTQLMMGIYPTKKYVDKVKTKYKTSNDIELPNKVLNQDKNLISELNKNFEKSQKINVKMDDDIIIIKNKLNTIESSFNISGEKQKTGPIDLTVGKFEIETESNKEQIKKLTDSIPDIERKKKENEEFFKKYVGEKKVWLDRLKENKIKDETYKKGFKYLYEAKIVKLILEGVLLEKVQDMVEKELYKRGNLFGWNIMDVQEMEKNKQEVDFQFNKGLLKLESGVALIQEKDYKEKTEKEEGKLQKEREETLEEWKRIWREIWIPDIMPSVDPNVITKRDFMINITMEVTFKLFQQIFFDIYKLKNIILSNDEYIIMDKIRSYFPEKNVPGRSQDELVLNQLMNIIESIKAEQDIIYCDLKPALKKIEEYRNSTETNTTAIDNLKVIVDKITNVQKTVNEKGGAFVKAEVEEIRKLINSLPYEKEKKLFLDNFQNSSRYYDTFLPLANILMVVTFMTIGKKRDKNYDTRIEEAKNEILTIKGKNNEISGKLNLLKEIKEKIGEEVANDIIEKSQEIGDSEAFQSHKILEEMKKSLNKIIELKNQHQMSTFNFYKKLRKAIIRPKDLC